MYVLLMQRTIDAMKRDLLGQLGMAAPTMREDDITSEETLVLQRKDAKVRGVRFDVKVRAVRFNN